MPSSFRILRLSRPRSLRLALASAAVAGLLWVGGLAAAPETAVEVKKGEDECPTSTPLTCGETVSGTLTGADCQDDQGRALDVFTFSGEGGHSVVATLEPSGFEGDLEIHDPNFDEYAAAEGQFPGQTVRLETVLDRTSDLWRVVVKTDDAGQTGPYDVTLECSDVGEPPPPPPPGDGFFIDPAYPDFRFRVRITPTGGPTIEGSREKECLPDTVCVSGALPGRSEVFLRILGPRPNGFLWPTIIRFTPSRVVVDIEQVSTGEVETYVLAAVPPGDEDLSGRQDRTGFLP